MVFREHPIPAPLTKRIVKRAKSGPKPAGVAAAMSAIGKELRPAERAILSTPMPIPWQREHVVDPAWIKALPGGAAVTHIEAPSTIIGNYEAKALKELFNDKLFDLRSRRPGEAPHVYELDDEPQEDLRTHLRNFMQMVVENAGVELPDNEDDLNLALDQIETKLAPDLKLLLKGLYEVAIRQLADIEEEQLDYSKLTRSIWQNHIVDCHISSDVSVQECLDFAIKEMGLQEVINYAFEGMLPLDVEKTIADLKRTGVVRL